MNYTEERFVAEQTLANELQFKENHMNVPYEIAAKVCNGIGASWFPEVIRKAVSKLNPSLVPVADCHDLGYYYGTGTASNFTRVNDAFRINGEKVARYDYEESKKKYEGKYKAWDIRRYLGVTIAFAKMEYVTYKANVFAELCEKHGWVAYVTAIKERKQAEKEA